MVEVGGEQIDESEYLCVCMRTKKGQDTREPRHTMRRGEGKVCVRASVCVFESARQGARRSARQRGRERQREGN